MISPVPCDQDCPLLDFPEPADFPPAPAGLFFPAGAPSSLSGMKWKDRELFRGFLLPERYEGGPPRPIGSSDEPSDAESRLKRKLVVLFLDSAPAVPARRC